MSVRPYLDCSTAHFTREQLGDDEATRRFVDDVETVATVLPHTHGAWILAADINAEYGTAHAEFAAQHPNVVEVMRYALARGCMWICADADGATIEDLRTFDW